MGTRDVRIISGSGDDRLAMQRVIRDLDALETMIERGVFETGVRRIGVEQEMVLIDRRCRPAPVGDAVIASAGERRLVPEIARFNVEFNCDPVELGGDCLSRMRAQVDELLGVVTRHAEPLGARPLLTGICPTIEPGQLTRENITPEARYYALDDGIRALRGSDYELHIDGADELVLRHPSVMLEAVNTSFQVHYQTSPEDFARDYNVALAVAAPVLAAAVNSPVLFGKRLWRETRIAIFQQVVDTRTGGDGRRESPGRVRFGEDWVRGSVLEVLRADVARFRQVLFSTESAAPDPFEMLDRGETPSLAAWQAFNSSVYRWMRPCFGLGGGLCGDGGRPHLRIENRVFPAGPTVGDEMANAAFWIGLMVEGPHAWPDLAEKLDFHEARGNFMRAARDGLAGHMTWYNGVDLPIQELIQETFLPAARAGLERAGVDAGDIDEHLGVIEARVKGRRTGARWLIDAGAKLRGMGKQSQRLERLTAEIYERQTSGTPVHAWGPLELSDEPNCGLYSTVSQCMTTDLFTVGENECIDLVASIMDWERLRHVPVENEKHELVGLISYRMVLRMLAKRRPSAGEEPLSAAQIMIRDPVTVSPDTSTLEAIELMGSHRVSCLPVVEDGRLVGVVSERDYTEIARKLLERALRAGDGADGHGGGQA